MFWSCAGIRSAVIAVWRQPRTATARTTPTIVPRPPKIETPPSRTAVTTKSSMPDARVVAGRREPERPEHAGEPADHPGEDEEPELDPLDADAGVEGCLLVRADREDRAPQRRCVEDDPEDDGEREEDRDRVRDVRVRDRDDADAREALREPADRVGRQDPLRDAAVERQRPDRDGERRQADAA